MKKITLFLLLLFPLCLFAQIGIKAGLNFAQVSKASDINNGSKSGYHVGVFLAPASSGILSSRTELIFSRQGYNYKSDSNSGKVDLDYLQLGQLLSINITKYFSLMFGAQTAILLNAKVDSSQQTNPNLPPGYGKLMDLYNRFDYGYALGAEVHPVMGLVIGARYNVSLAKVYKDLENFQRPSFTSADARNNVVQLYAGWRFGGNKTKKSKELQSY
jgi:Outer membrane protein beta-barrel domain